MILKSKNNNFTKIKKLFQKNKINKDINELVLSKKGPLVKKDLNILLTTKMITKLDLYVYFSQIRVHIEKTLMKPNVCLL